MAMHRVGLAVTFLFMPIYLVAMDRPQKRGLSSIIALDIFDNKFTTPPAPERLLRESELLGKREMQTDPRRASSRIIADNALAKSKKSFEEFLRCKNDTQVHYILSQSPILRANNSLAKNIWDVCYNKSPGFSVSSPEDYEEAIVPLECIVTVSLLLACKKNNKIFLSHYQQTHGTQMLHKIIGNSLYEQMYGAIALKNVIGVNAYKKFKQEEKIKVQLQRMEDIFSNDETENW